MRSALGWAFVVVALASAAWFVWKSGLLSRTLNDHYSRAIARFGREVEARQQNYAKVIENLTEMASEADAGSPAEIALKGAEARALAIQGAEESVKLRTRALREKLTKVEEQLGGEQRAGGAQSVQPEREAVATALAETRKSLTDFMTVALRVAFLRVHADDLRAHAERVVKGQQVPFASDQGSPQKDKDALIEAVKSLRSDLGQAEEALNGRLRALIVAMKGVPGLAMPDKGEPLAEQLAELLTEPAAAQRGLRLAQDPTDASLVRHTQIQRLILPSYRKPVDACMDRELPEERDLCVARAVVRATESLDDSIRQGLEVVKCDASTPRDSVVLSTDRRVVTFAPRSSASLQTCGRISTERLMAGLRQSGQDTGHGPAPRTFDTIVVLDEKGNVVLGPESDSTLRFTKLPSFEEQHAAASHLASEVVLGPRKYSAFVQPLGMAFVTACDGAGCESGKKPARLLLAGLVSEERLFKERLEVTPGTYLWAVVLLGALVLALPLAKLWLLNHTSRLRRFDVGLLVTSAGAATLMAILVSLTAAAYSELKATLDSDLESVAKKLSARLDEQRNVGQRLLAAYQFRTQSFQNALGPRQSEELKKACLDAGGSFIEAVRFSAGGVAASACEEVQVSSKPDAQGAAAPAWIHAFLADASGRQRLKSAPGEHAPTPISVAERPYFKRALERYCAGELCGSQAALEVVRSATTGALLLVVAAPFDGGQPATPAEPKGVAGITLPLGELQQPVLPLGFQSAVIDGQGRVMLHSSEGAFQGQSLLEDVGDPALLRATLASSTPATHTMRYLGERSRLHVRRITGSDWSVVVAAPFSLVDLVLTRSVLITLVGFGVLFIVTLLVLALIALLASWVRSYRPSIEQESALSLRPRAASTRDYYDAARFMLWGLVPALIGLAVPCASLPLWLVPLSLAVAFGGVMRMPGLGRDGALAVLRPAQGSGWFRPLRWWLGEAHASGPSRLGFPQAYAAACFALAYVLVTVPAAILFASAYDNTVETMARAQQQHVASAGVPSRCQASPHRCPRVFLPDAPAAEVSLLPPGFWMSRARDELIASVHDWLPAFEPVRGSAAALMALAGAPADPPGVAWSWRRSYRQLSLGPGHGEPWLVSALPPVGWSARGLLPLISLVLFALASFALSLRVFRRLFHTRLLAELGYHSQDELAAAILQRAPASGQKSHVYIPHLPWSKALALKDRLASLGLPADGRAPVLLSPDNGDNPPLALNAKPWVILTSEADLLLAPNWLEQLRDFEVMRRAPVAHRFLSSLTPPKPLALKSLWEGCDEHEQRVLAQIALDGYANPHPNTAAVLRSLADKGLIDPATLALPRRAFGDYILSQLDPSQVTQWEQAEKNTSWSAMRGVLLTALATLTAILTAIQPSLGAATATVPALAAAMPTLLRVLTIFAGGADSAK